jgi:hypothetical protein
MLIINRIDYYRYSLVTCLRCLIEMTKKTVELAPKNYTLSGTTQDSAIDVTNAERELITD